MILSKLVYMTFCDNAAGVQLTQQLTFSKQDSNHASVFAPMVVASFGNT